MISEKRKMTLTQKFLVAGHQSGLRVLPSSEIYLKEDHTVLKLREKIFSWSGDDCSVKDMEDRKWFKIEGSALSMTNKRTMSDTEGRVIAGYRKKLLSLHATAYITLEISGETMVYATIRRKMQLTPGAKIFIHNVSRLYSTVQHSAAQYSALISASSKVMKS